MFKALFFMIVGIGLGLGAFYLSNPDLATKAFDEDKVKVEKFLEDLKKNKE